MGKYLAFFIDERILLNVYVIGEYRIENGRIMDRGAVRNIAVYGSQPRLRSSVLAPFCNGVGDKMKWYQSQYLPYAKLLEHHIPVPDGITFESHLFYVPSGVLY